MACFFAIPFAATAGEVLSVRRVANGVYMIPGVIGEAAPSNRGQVVNTGFIVGRDGVIVIDSGANQSQGEAILATVERITNKPVKLLINTHPHPQNVLGNAAFAERGIPVLATAATVIAMGERCPRCLKSLAISVGAEAMRGTRIHLPETGLSGSKIIDIAGRRLRLLHFGHGHTEGDLAVFDEATAVLFTGDLVYGQQIPHLSESNITGWQDALSKLAEVPFRILIPGRGPVGDNGSIELFHRYLRDLADRVAVAYHDGRSADEAILLADLPEYSAWQGYLGRHGRNVQHVYFEIEKVDLNGRTGALQ